jgi:hypothetical protein
MSIVDKVLAAVTRPESDRRFAAGLCFALPVAMA